MVAAFVADVEAAFARAETHAELGDFEHALRWLATGEHICGGLPPEHLAKRLEWNVSLTLQRPS